MCAKQLPGLVVKHSSYGRSSIFTNDSNICTFHDGCKQGIDQQIFDRKSISHKITHPQSLFK